jgi:acetylornithine deacetylase/succinyl-diaminopimelate desuccinylase-like protein
MRAVPGQTEETVRADLLELMGGLDLEEDGFTYEVIVPAASDALGYPAMPATAPEHPLVQALVSSHAEVVGVEPPVGAGDRIGLAADSGHLKLAGIPTVEYGPGSHPVWPMVDERIRIKDIVVATQVLVGALERLLS